MGASRRCSYTASSRCGGAQRPPYHVPTAAMFSSDGRLAVVIRSDGHVLALRTQGGEVIGALHAFGRDAADEPGMVGVYGEPGGDALVFVGARSVARWSLTEDTVTALTTPVPPHRFELGTFWRTRATWVARGRER
ncbi:MAG: hypothetical protein KC668_18640 [Myxococcales bacterium]|nr:hypothetical protein [Myxococcales bacterium]